MSRNKRFALLDNEEKPDGDSAPAQVEIEIPRKQSVQGLKVIVDESEFARNLEKHKLTEKVHVIEKKKFELKEEAAFARKNGAILIAAGTLLIALVLRKFIFAETVSRELRGDVMYVTGVRNQMTDLNFFIISCIASVCLYWFFQTKNNRKK